MERKDHNLINDLAKHTALPEKENEAPPAKEKSEMKREKREELRLIMPFSF